MISIIKKRIKNDKTINLLEEIIESFLSPFSNLFQRRGIPLGNLTSQLFANIYMNEFDQFVKQNLRIKNYIRYTDDFIIVSADKNYLGNLIPKFSKFLEKKLELELHPNKVMIGKLHKGIDFLGYIIFPNYRLVRTKTKRRIFSKLNKKFREYKIGKIDKLSFERSLQSYLGVLSHADTYKVIQQLKNQFWV